MGWYTQTVRGRHFLKVLSSPSEEPTWLSTCTKFGRVGRGARLQDLVPSDKKVGLIRPRSRALAVQPLNAQVICTLVLDVANEIP